MVGQNIGKYRVLDRIGRGGMGTVYRAIDETLHREVAIKVLNAELNDPSVARRFRAEAVTVARLNHPGIATVYELFQHEGQWLMVMEFVRGETLEALVVRKGPLDPTEAVELCMQALAALAHAHSLGVVHRDLKPANIMVTESGTVKVMDFGIARVVGTEHLTSAGFMMGTPAYMAPEQVLGEDIDARADLYAMGVVFYHLCTNKLPFKGNTPFEMAQSRLRDLPTPVRSLRGELPAWLEQLFEIAIHREPARRFQSAPVFREALRRGLANLPIETPEAASIPAELVTTAPPGTMPSVDTGATPAGSGPVPVRAAIPKPAPAMDPATVATPAVPPKPAASVKPVVPAKPASAPKGMPWAAIAVAVVVVIGFAAWMLLRPSAPPAAPETTVAEAPATDIVQAPAPEPPAVTAEAQPAAVAPATDGATVPPASDPATPPAAGAATPPATGAAASTSVAGSGAAPARGTSTAGGTTASATARGRGRGAPPPPDPALDFKDVRLLVVAGNRAEEQNGTLNFGGGRVGVSVEQSGAVLASMPYGDVTYAAYARAKDPTWSPVLAAPPANVNLPGGLFTPARHWLTLQSRVSFIIVRLNDANWRAVIEAVTARTGVQVAVPAAGRQ